MSWKSVLCLLTCCGVLLFAQSFAVAQDDQAANDEKTEAKADETGKTEGEEKAEEHEPGSTYAPGFSGADTAWMLICSALVLMMTAPGLALFYGGLVRKKNILGVMMQCVFLMGLLSLVWAVLGFSLAFGKDILGGFCGGFDHILMKGVVPTWEGTYTEVPMKDSIPMVVFMAFQGMFFIITPALICGAYAERVKFSAMCVFSVLWGLLVYCPLCHWVWADGWLSDALDFAGGTVVHISSGVSGLVCCLVLGKRLGYGQEQMPPHNLTYTCIGAAMLWVGWFGFNAGSQLAVDAITANAFVATHIAAAAGLVAWAVGEWFMTGKPTILGACSGAIAGLVCITPACGTATPVSGILIGAAGGVVCLLACAKLKPMFGYDDSLDAFGIHGFGGTVGALLTGVFATRVVHGGKEAVGVIDGNVSQMVPQFLSVVAAWALAAIGTFIILKVIDATMGMRVSQDHELEGIDLSQHGEEGYIFQ